MTFKNTSGSMLWSLSAVALAVSLTACGGGSTSTPTETPTYELTGNAVKGVMKGAKVVAYKVNSDGSKGDALGETTTDANGKYSITVKNYFGVVLVEVTALTGTTMYDEATGADIAPAAGFMLRASAVSPALSTSGGSVSTTLTLQANPLTEMAVASAAKSTGGLSQANVEKANSDLAASLGFNPTTDKPAFVNGVPTNKAAVTLTAISKMAKADDLGACASAANQASKVKCVVDQLASGGLSDALVAASLNNQIAAVKDQPGIDATIVPVITPPAPTGTPETTALAQTKAFMATLRSNAKALDALDVSLQTELQAVADDMRGQVAPMSGSTLDAFQLATQAAQFWNDFQADPSTVPPMNRTFYRDNGYFAEIAGGCGMYSDANYLVLATTKADAKYVACGTAPQWVWTNGVPSAWSTRVRLHPSATADEFTVYTKTRKAMLVQNNQSLWVEPSPTQRTEFGAAHPGNAATLKAQRNLSGDIVAVQFVGEMSPSYSLETTAQWVNGYAQNSTTATVLGDKLKANLAGSWTVDGAGVNTLALKGLVEKYRTVNAVDQLDDAVALEEGSYVKGSSLSVSQVNNQPVVGGDGSHAMVLKLRFNTAKSALAGTFAMTNSSLDKSKTVYMPTKMSFAGSVERMGQPFFSGSVAAEALNFSSFMANQPLSATNVQSMKATIAGAVAIKDRATLNLNLVMTGSDKGAAGATNSLSGQYRQGATVINVSGQSGTGTASMVTLDSSTGIRLVLDGSKTTHPMTKSGVAVGTFNSTTNRVDYADGSYEQY